MKEEIKQLYNKKAKLKIILCNLHLELLGKIHPVHIHNVMSYINERITKTVLLIIQDTIRN